MLELISEQSKTRQGTRSAKAGISFPSTLGTVPLQQVRRNSCGTNFLRKSLKIHTVLETRVSSVERLEWKVVSGPSPDFWSPMPRLAPIPLRLKTNDIALLCKISEILSPAAQDGLSRTLKAMMCANVDHTVTLGVVTIESTFRLDLRHLCFPNVCFFEYAVPVTFSVKVGSGSFSCWLVALVHLACSSGAFPEVSAIKESRLCRSGSLRGNDPTGC